MFYFPADEEKEKKTGGREEREREIICSYFINGD